MRRAAGWPPTACTTTTRTTTPDPHSPLVEFFLEPHGLADGREPRRPLGYSAYERYARDVLRDPFYMRLQRSMLPLWIYVAHAPLYYLAGLALGWGMTGDWRPGVQFGLSLLVWGVLLRTVCVWHISWTVNSLRAPVRLSQLRDRRTTAATTGWWPS